MDHQILDRRTRFKMWTRNRGADDHHPTALLWSQTISPNPLIVATRFEIYGAGLSSCPTLILAARKDPTAQITSPTPREEHGGVAHRTAARPPELQFRSPCPPIYNSLAPRLIDDLMNSFPPLISSLDKCKAPPTARRGNAWPRRSNPPPR